ncbi:hypothetical protein ABDI30_24600, partial [Paenibacillus cisolokensis]|uniref:hypothetical protein n=1 Tax=Paenibacillus cisolokensis TaxID=1658519 RepID=UPI003D2A7065
MKRVSIYLLVVSWLLIAFFIRADPVLAAQKVVAESTDKEDTATLPPPEYHPKASNGPTAYQKKVIRVEGVRQANPGVYWYQIDDGRFRAETRLAPGGLVHTNNAGTQKLPVPAVAEVAEKIEMKSNPFYKPTRYESLTKDSYTVDEVRNEIITKVETLDNRQGQDSEIIKLEITDMKTATIITSLTGNRFVPFLVEDTGNEAWGDRCGCYLGLAEQD